MSSKTLLTAAELEQMPGDDSVQIELDQGQLIRMPFAGMDHGDCGAEIAYLLKDFVKKHDLGKVYSTPTPDLKLSEDTVRAPDVAFVRKERVPVVSWEGIRQGSAGSGRRDFLAVRQCAAAHAQGQAVL